MGRKIGYMPWIENEISSSKHQSFLEISNINNLFKKNINKEHIPIYNDIKFGFRF